jgi:hypothetical protein
MSLSVIFRLSHWQAGNDQWLSGPSEPKNRSRGMRLLLGLIIAVPLVLGVLALFLFGFLPAR